MTVAELIEALKALPGTLPVTRADTDYDEVPVDRITVLTGKHGISDIKRKRVKLG